MVSTGYGTFPDEVPSQLWFAVIFSSPKSIGDT